MSTAAIQAMTRPRLLDLFCGAGGASKGYADAGFDVVGVDVNPQPRYPFEFHQADALTFPLDGFAAVHASPPCQDHTAMYQIGTHGTGWMLAATIKRLTASGLPFIVENVPGADMPGAFVLCGRSFGVARLKRHRLFLTNFPAMVPPCACSRRVQPIGVYGDLRERDRNDNGRIRAGVQTARDLLDCPWMDAKELSQAIPPAYTRFIGEHLITSLAPAGAR